MIALPRNKLPIRIPLLVVFIVSFVIQVVLIAGLISYLSFRNEQEAVNNVAHRLRGDITARIENHLQAFLATPHQINRVNASAIQQGVIAANDLDTLQRRFWEQIQIFDSVSSIYFGNTTGGVVNAGREGAGGLMYVITTDNFTSGVFRKYTVDKRGNRDRLLMVSPNFDARVRPWYTGAVAKGDATWSNVYILFTKQDMVISASRPVYDEQKNFQGVVSVDIFLSQLSSFLKSLDIGETGQSFIIDRSGLLIASSTDEKPFKGDQQRLYASESAIPLIHHAAEALTKQFGDYNHITNEQQLEFEIDGQPQFLQVLPFQDEYGLDWLVVTVIPEIDFMAQVYVNNRTTSIVIGITLIMTIILSFFIARWVTRPILRLNTLAQALTKGVWQQTMTNDWIAELSELTTSFNQMAQQLQQTLKSLTAEIAERKQIEEALRESNCCLEKTLTELKETQDKMVQQERLAAVGQLAAGIAHDFNNILTSMLGFAELLRVSSDTPALMQADLAKIITSGQRATHLVHQILDFSRKSIRQPRQFDLAHFIKEVMKFLERTIPENIRLNLEVTPGTYLIEADPTQMQQILANLAVNARDAMPSGGELWVILSHVEALGEISCMDCNQIIEGSWISLAVMDTGGGISPDILPHIFEPFFTTKEVGHGSGLGLSQVLGIVQQNGGHITVDSQVNQGTTFTVYLPLLEQGQTKIETDAPIPIQQGQGQTILLVEDEPIVLEAFKAMLQQLGYQILTATNGLEALAVYAEYQEVIVLILSDIVMPDMQGEVLFNILKNQNQDIRFVMMSGYPLEEKGAQLLEQGVVDWFQKPVSLRNLSKIISRALLYHTENCCIS